MRDGCLTQYWRPAPSLRQFSRTGGWARSDAFIELRASVFGQPVIVVDEPELTAIGAALIAAQGATGVALPFGQTGAAKVEPVVAWTESYAKLYQDYRVRLDAATARQPSVYTSEAGSLQRGLNRERVKFGDAT